MKFVFNFNSLEAIHQETGARQRAGEHARSRTVTTMMMMTPLNLMKRHMYQDPANGEGEEGEGEVDGPRGKGRILNPTTQKRKWKRSQREKSHVRGRISLHQKMKRTKKKKKKKK